MAGAPKLPVLLLACAEALEERRSLPCWGTRVEGQWMRERMAGQEQSGEGNKRSLGRQGYKNSGKNSSEKLERMLWRQCRETGVEVLHNHYTSALETRRGSLFLHLFLAANHAECAVYPGQADHLEGWNSASWYLICSASISKDLSKSINTPLLSTN